MCKHLASLHPFWFDKGLYSIIAWDHIAFLSYVVALAHTELNEREFRAHAGGEDFENTTKREGKMNIIIWKDAPLNIASHHHNIKSLRTKLNKSIYIYIYMISCLIAKNVIHMKIRIRKQSYKWIFLFMLCQHLCQIERAGEGTQGYADEWKNKKKMW
ncbi:hypothetical protein ACJX0J_019350, partial [Zea mays]